MPYVLGSYYIACTEPGDRHWTDYFSASHTISSDNLHYMRPHARISFFNADVTRRLVTSLSGDEKDAVVLASRCAGYFRKLASRNGRFLSTVGNKVDEPLKVEEAETVNVPPPAEKLLVLGGNGFVGSHICKEALDRGLSVHSLSRSGRSSLQEAWADKVIWHQGNLLSVDSLKEAFSEVTSVISCIGGFGSNSYMYKINGTANINAIRAAAEQGVKRYAYISATDFGLVNYLLQGYYEGKRAAETELLTKFPYGGVILRPGFIYGTRRVGSLKLPLGVIGSPLEMVLQYAKPLNQVPLVGPLLSPPVNVTAVAKVAVRAATDPVFPPGIVDIHGLLRYSNQKSI